MTAVAPTRILVLPGIGDIYWVMVKLQAWCAARGIERPEVYVWDFDGRRRSLEYVERIPFVKAGGYFEHAITPGKIASIFRASYQTGAQSVFKGFLGFDYYIAVNGALRVGRSVDDVFPGVKADWCIELTITKAEQAFTAQYKTRWPQGYIVAHLSDMGMFRNWVTAWGVESCSRFVAAVRQGTGLPVVLTGSSWDAPFSKLVEESAGCESLVGQTNADQFFSLFRNAAGCVGWCGGNTILATSFKVPTLILWHRYFPKPAFFKNACPPEAWEKWYEALSVDQVKPEFAAERFVALWRANQ